jgi:spore germination protein
VEQNEYESMNNHKGIRNKKRGSWSIPIAILAIMALVGVASWGYYQNKELKELQIAVNNQYNRAFIDLSDYVDNVEVLLSKSMVTASPKSTSGMLEQIWRQANLAQTNMGQLPISPPVLEKTSNFLTQVGDLAYALNTKTLDGNTLSDKEYSNIKQLHGYAVSLQNNLHGIEDQINAGKMTWGGSTGRARLLSTSKSRDPQTSQIENVDKNFQEYPSLIYDGPYSDHMLKSKPLGLKSDKVTADEAQKLVKKILGNDNIQEVRKLDTNETGSIKTFRFKVIYKNSTDEQGGEINITQQGGQIYWMLRNRDFGKDTLSMGAAKKAASAFLTKNGFKNMVDTYYQKVDGTAVICYAYSQDNVVAYPDLVKVKVALDNGEIVGIESKGYLYNHRVRQIPKSKLTIEEARKKINSKLDITSQGRAIIPTDFKTEKYCYEFKGKTDSRDFIVYINAATGAEENVLMLITTENGTLTM